MINDIHALYAEKQKQYQDYLVEKRVHEQNLKTATDNLLQNIQSLRDSLQNIESPLAARINAVLDRCSSAENLQYGHTVMELIEELRTISSELENEIREALA